MSLFSSRPFPDCQKVLSQIRSLLQRLSLAALLTPEDGSFTCKYLGRHDFSCSSCQLRFVSVGCHLVIGVDAEDHWSIAAAAAAQAWDLIVSLGDEIEYLWR